MTTPQEQGPSVDEKAQVVIDEARRNLGGSPPDAVHTALVTELEARGIALDTAEIEQAARDISEHRAHPVDGGAAEQG